jgi:flavin reductase (DIM6/NTAB) family NADH-FMN oxidoreductase RutF
MIGNIYRRGEKMNNKDQRNTHEKFTFDKPGNVLYPVPAVLVSCQSREGRKNVFTVAWTGTVCSDPPMVSISVRKSRFSHDMICDTGEFVINLTTKELVRATDFCGVRSGRDIDKFEACHLTAGECQKVKAPLVVESPINIECRVKQMIGLGSHDMFIAEVVAVDADKRLMDKNGKFHMEDANLIAYNHGSYFELGKMLGSFGYSVKKQGKKKSRRSK